MAMSNYNQYFFVLGGEDNEMVEIKKILNKKDISYIQPQIKWGKINIEKSDLPFESVDRILVFVECRPNWINEKDSKKYFYKPGTKFRILESILIIDHHNELAHQPASLLQVLDLLEIRPKLRQKIIASIDADFLQRTIDKWPKQKEKIINIWETGYQKAFERKEEYIEFKKYSKDLYQNAKSNSEKDEILTIEKAPNSVNWICALMDFDRRQGMITVADLEYHKKVPCFYFGDSNVVKFLSYQQLKNKYWSKYRLGCKAVPGEFLKMCRTLVK